MTEPTTPSHAGPASPRRGGVVLVELIRLVVVVAFTAAGYQIGHATAGPASATVLLAAVLGAGVGYVGGGILGRTIGTLVGVVERRIVATPGADIVAGGLGMVVGGLVGSLVSWPLLFLPARAVGAPVFAFVTVVLGYLGFRIGVLKREDVLQLVGLTYRTRAGDLRVLDTSAILDPRLLDYVHVGIVRGTLLLPGFVLEEAQGIADAADTFRRQRARQGLEALQVIRREGLADVQFVDRTYPAYSEVDAKILALSRERGAGLVTDDLALAHVAELQGIEVLLLRQVATALRPAVLPGEKVRLDLIRTGTDAGQAVGYLEDGTLVVVEDAEAFVGTAVDAVISRAVSTRGGRMLFAKRADAGI